MCTMGPSALLRYLFPLVVEVSQLAESKFELEDEDHNPDARAEFMKSAVYSTTPVSAKYVNNDGNCSYSGAFLINNGRQLILFVGENCPQTFLTSVSACDGPGVWRAGLRRTQRHGEDERAASRVELAAAGLRAPD